MNNFSLNHTLFAAAAFITLVVFGGCGSGFSEESTSSSQASPSKQSMGSSAAVAKGIRTMPGEAKPDETRNPSRDRERHGNRANSQSAQRGGSEGQRTPAEVVDGRVKELLGGAGGGDKQVVAPPKAVGKILKELKEGSSKEDPKGSPEGSVTEAIEEILDR